MVGGEWLMVDGWWLVVDGWGDSDRSDWSDLAIFVPIRVIRTTIPQNRVFPTRFSCRYLHNPFSQNG